MVAFVLVLLFAGTLLGVLATAGELRPQAPLPKVIIGGYVLRLVLQSFLRDIPFFSSGAGADCAFYEKLGVLISAVWSHEGVHFVTSAELPELGPTSLPPNLFGLVIYLNGGEATRLGCTALVALGAALAALNIYKLAVLLGAEPKAALLFTSIIYFEPAFLFYTSDTYKDALVICFTLGAIGSAIRVSRRFSLVHVVIGLTCLWALWYVRFYLIFVTLAPLLVGLTGFGAKGITRPLLATLALAVAAIALAVFTDILQLASDKASQTFEVATGANVLQENARGGSGVVFDDGGVPYGALPTKLAYTLFSPFPWASGSLGFQIGKLDVLLWYFIVYRAVRGARQTDMRLVLMIAAFLVPCTLMYAMSMSNVGLIVRQRLVIVAVTAVLAAIYKPAARVSSRTRTATRARRQFPARRPVRAA